MHSDPAGHTKTLKKQIQTGLGIISSNTDWGPSSSPNVLGVHSLTLNEAMHPLTQTTVTDHSHEALDSARVKIKRLGGELQLSK